MRDLDEAGVDVQLISATPILFQWDRSPEAGLDVSRYFNDAAIEMCEESGGRLRALCQVPLQDVHASCHELERAKANGHVGVHIGNHVAARDLDDAELVTFLQHCADVNMPVLVHPWDMDPLDGRLKNYMMGWTVGMPLETHLSITSMILGGAFDRLPQSLRICFAHGGGAFAFLLGRLENAWRERELARGKSLYPPSHYLDRFSVDSAVFDPGALRLLVDTMGAERVMLGSDYPFPLGEQSIGSLVRLCTSLSEYERRLILGANASHFFSIEPAKEVQARAASTFTTPGLRAPSESSQQLDVPSSVPRIFETPPLEGFRRLSEAGGERRTNRVRNQPHPVKTPTPAVATTFPHGVVPVSTGALSGPRPNARAFRRALMTRVSACSNVGKYSAAGRGLGHTSRATWFDDTGIDIARIVTEAGASGNTIRGLSNSSVAIDSPAVSSCPNVVLNFVGGRACASETGETLSLIDAASGAWRGEVAASTAADVDAAVAIAASALRDDSWACLSPTERAAVLLRAATLLEEQSERFAAAESADTGKPLRLARAMDIPRAITNLRFFAGLAEHSMSGMVRHGGGAGRGGDVDLALNYSVRKPVGVVGLVAPWNLPLYLLTWKLAPALAMGNAVVAKPSELTPTTASMLGEIFQRAGLPDGVFNVVHGKGAVAGAALCAHPSVGAVSFTGGSNTGTAVAQAVAPRFAKLSLELGGKNALLVFADCDFDATVHGAVRAAFLNSGQSALSLRD